MRTIVAAVLAACFAVPAMAQDMVFEDGGVAIRLMQGPCAVPPVLAALRAAPNLQTAPKAARVTYRGQTIEACWAVDADDDVLIGDALGGNGYLPMTAFRKAKST